MRRSKQSEVEPPTQAAPTLTPAALPRVRAVPDPAGDVPGLSDLERGRTAALIASLGRVQLTLDLIERRLGRLEDTVASLVEQVAGVPAATLELLDVVAVEDEAPHVHDDADEAAAPVPAEPLSSEPEPEEATEPVGGDELTGDPAVDEVVVVEDDSDEPGPAVAF